MSYAIIDKKMPEDAKIRLRLEFSLIELSTQQITYDAISGHPDIFFCQVEDKIIFAKNLPADIRSLIPQKSSTQFIEGEKDVGLKYPENIPYNVSVRHPICIHHFEYTDTYLNKSLQGFEKWQVNQGYSRCNTIILNENFFITSDQPTFEMIQKKGREVLFIQPDPILLPGFNHGFIGGCMGILKKNIYVTGQLDFLKERTSFMNFTKKAGYKVIELYKGPLMDVGSIIFF